jgi:Domain of unknown function (DUF4148)
MNYFEWGISRTCDDETLFIPERSISRPDITILSMPCLLSRHQAVSKALRTHVAYSLSYFLRRIRMRLRSKLVVSAVLLIASASAVAAQNLTPQECNDYPFRQPTGEVTHAQLIQELSELESVGYNPTDDDLNYPTNLQQAEQRLQAKYRADCAPAAHLSDANTPAGGAATWATTASSAN